MRTGAKSLAGFAALALTASQASALTIVVDMKSAAQGNTTDSNGYSVGAFNYAGFGFNTAAQQNALDSAVLQTLKDDYFNIPTQATLPSSPIPAGFQLNINFVLGDIGTAPGNGDPEYYYAQIGNDLTGSGLLGVAGQNQVRNAAGAHGWAGNGQTTCSIFSGTINGIGGLSPTNALTSGSLTYSQYAIAGTLAHEIGHNLSLSHISKANSLQPSGALGGTNLPPIMGTGAIDLPNIDRIGPREFSLSGFEGAAPRAQIAQLVTAVGLRAIPEPSLLATAAFAAAGLLRRQRRSH
ncbi:MAG: hypothetical protein QM754_02830 [Tepidisphaeraceae bacterium]